jgi:hypothetical protein
MALPSSGQISFNDVRTETQQSSLSNYKFGYWVGGCIEETVTYAPINLNSTAHPFSSSGSLNYPYSMSQWYSYNATAITPWDTTSSFYQHIIPLACCVNTSMLMYEVTASTTVTFNISGAYNNSTIYNGWRDVYWYLYYGKPWSSNGGSGSPTLLTSSKASSSADLTPVNISFNQNVTYDAGQGNYLYLVISEVSQCCLFPEQCVF